MNAGQILQPRHDSRRWPRYKVELPVRIVGFNGMLTNPVTGRASDISRAGMALYASLALKPGDQMQVQFPTSQPSRVNAVIRNRNGNCFGLEFLSQLPPDSEATDQLSNFPASVVSVLSKSRCLPQSCTPKSLDTALQRKQEELKQLQKEIEVLSVAILLLAEDENEICRMPLPGRLELDVKPWPQLS